MSIAKRITIDGASWPVTGHWCQVCGLPLWRVDGSTTHPTCGPEAPSALTPASTEPRGPFVPPTGPGRCTRCGFHTPTQGQRTGCSEGTAP